MNAQVAVGAAAVLFLHVEHAPAGDSVTAAEADVRVIGLADLGLLHGILAEHHVVRPAAGLAGEQNLSAGVRYGEHLLRVTVGQRQRLLAHDVRAGLQCRDRPCLMRQIRGADGYDIQLVLVLIQHLLRVGVPLRDIPALSRFLRRFFPDIGAGNDLGQPLLSEVIDGRKVCAVADHSGADQCNTEFLAHSSFLTYHIKSFKGITLPPL